MIRIEHINTKSVVFNLLKIRHFLINIKILLVYVHLLGIHFWYGFCLEIQTPLTRAAMVSHELSNEIKVPPAKIGLRAATKTC